MKLKILKLITTSCHVPSFLDDLGNMEIAFQTNHRHVRIFSSDKVSDIMLVNKDCFPEVPRCHGKDVIIQKSSKSYLRFNLPDKEAR